MSEARDIVDLGCGNGVVGLKSAAQHPNATVHFVDESFMAVGDQIAKRLFRQAHTVLRPGSELWVIGNRHLGYHVTLKRLFGNADVVACNAKFVILRVVRRSK